MTLEKPCTQKYKDDGQESGSFEGRISDKGGGVANGQQDVS